MTQPRPQAQPCLQTQPRPHTQAAPHTLALTLLLALPWAAPLNASAADPAAPTYDAGALLRQVEQSRQATQDQRALRQLTPLPPALVLDEAQTVYAKRFQFVGVRLLPSEALDIASARFANRPLRAADLDALAAAVVDKYRQSGWVVRAYVPNQPLGGDSLTVQVLETPAPRTSR